MKTVQIMTTGGLNTTVGNARGIGYENGHLVVDAVAGPITFNRKHWVSFEIREMPEDDKETEK